MPLRGKCRWRCHPALVLSIGYLYGWKKWINIRCLMCFSVCLWWKKWIINVSIILLFSLWMRKWMKMDHKALLDLLSQIFFLSLFQFYLYYLSLSLFLFHILNKSLTLSLSIPPPLSLSLSLFIPLTKSHTHTLNSTSTVPNSTYIHSPFIHLPPLT